MTTAEPNGSDLRSVFIDSTDPTRRAPDCPDPTMFWEALSGVLGAPDTRRIIEHTVHCPACAEAWRVARAMGAMERDTGLRRLSTAWRITMAAAAMLILAVGLAVVVPTWRQDDGVRYRSGQGLEIVSQVPEDAPQPRDNFVLRWSAGPEGTVYGISLTTESFSLVHAANNLERPECHVPQEALTGIPDETRLLWRVDAILPDGRMVRSDTFFILLE